MSSQSITVWRDFYSSRFSLYRQRLLFCLIVLLSLFLVLEHGNAEYLPDSVSHLDCGSDSCTSLGHLQNYPQVEVRVGDTKASLVTANESGGIIVTVDTRELGSTVKGNIPLEFHSKSLEGVDRHLWHPSVNETNGWYDSLSENLGGQKTSVLNEQQIHLLFKVPPEKAGMSFRIILDRKDSLSNLATWSAVATQMAGMHQLGAGRMSTAGALLPVVMGPEYSLDTLLRWSHLVLGINMTDAIHNMLGSRAWAEQHGAVSRCLADLGQAWTVAKFTQYGRDQGEYINNGQTGHKDAVKVFLGTNPTNAMMDCVSNAVTNTVREILLTESVDSFLHSSIGFEYQTVDEDIVKGIGKLITAYGLDLIFFQFPEFSSSAMARLLFVSSDENTRADVSNAVVTSVQYTLFEGYQQLFTGVARAKGVPRQQAALYGSRFAYVTSFVESGARLLYSLQKIYRNPEKVNEEAVQNGMKDRLAALKKERMFKSASERVEAVFAFGTNTEVDSAYWLNNQYVRETIVKPIVTLAGKEHLSEEKMISGLGHLIDTGVELWTGGHVILTAKSMTGVSYLTPIAPIVTTAGYGIILSATLFDLSELNRMITGGLVQYGADAAVDYYSMDRGTVGSLIFAGQTDIHIMIEEVVTPGASGHINHQNKVEL